MLCFEYAHPWAARGPCHADPFAQTRHAIQRFFEWLQQTGEAALVARRAVSRTRIVKVMAKELNTGGG